MFVPDEPPLDPPGELLPPKLFYIFNKIKSNNNN